MYITFASVMQIKQPTTEETSLEIQNRGTSVPKLGYVNVSAKDIEKNFPQIILS